MILPDFNKLWEPYARDGATLEGSRKWMLKACPGIPEAVVDQVIAETMLEMAGGKSFTEPCQCGCGITNAHTAIEHHMATRARELHVTAGQARSDVLQTSLHSLMLDHISRENAAFEADNLKPGKIKRVLGKVFKRKQKADSVDGDEVTE